MHVKSSARAKVGITHHHVNACESCVMGGKRSLGEKDGSGVCSDVEEVDDHFIVNMESQSCVWLCCLMMYRV